ncbi:Fis family transcriptional regulator [Marispirochaeta aestuarii]|uniref:Fis family transcriptional regulator n=1 Tax=Marispirochaeta aestuarii TaxID=1963862 RepID=UPI0029C6F035|nr:Fis family transcriptional regulator [Marispirochaeta aestuarii]
MKDEGTFESFLIEEDILEEVQERAIKKVLAVQLMQEIENRNISKTAFAKQMGTSRSALDRLLDPENSSVTLLTIEKAARVIGKRLKMELV